MAHISYVDEVRMRGQLRGCELKVFIFICDYIRLHKQGGCRLGLRYIAASVDYSRGQVQSAVASLVGRGFLEQIYTGFGGWRGKSILRPIRQVFARVASAVRTASQFLTCPVRVSAYSRRYNNKENDADDTTLRKRSDGAEWTDEGWRRRCERVGRSW